MAKTLLLADDSVTIQKVVGISFASEDMTLVTVDNGDDAVERARELRPNVILADVVMPGKNGYEVCEAIKADPNLAHIPVLLLTGTFEAFDEERAARVGAAGHVSKPFEAQTLVDRVNRLLAEAPAPAPAPAAVPQAAEAITRPRIASAESEDSFDFFDDDLGELSPPEESPAADGEPAGLEFESPDEAFSFGDEELAPADAEPQPATPAAARPTARAREPEGDFAAFSAPERTVAMGADAPQRTARPSPAPPSPRVSATPPDTAPSTLTAEFDDSEFEASKEDFLGGAADDPEDSLAPIDPSASADDAFDFAFDGDASESRGSVGTDPIIDDARVSVAARDLAEATVLDPKGASGFDVSSSDLGDPFAVAPRKERAGPPPPTRLMDVPELVAEPVEAAEILDAPQTEDALEPALFESDGEPEKVASEPKPASRPRPPRSRESLRDADSERATLTPRWRGEIHDTVEKIAWECFSDVTDRIVAQAVEQLERIAWEVVPRMAETLVKEEIRRMKGDAED